MADKKRIYLCLAHMSDAGLEQKYIKEAFDTNWVVPLGPNVNGFDAKNGRYPPTQNGDIRAKCGDSRHPWHHHGSAGEGRPAGASWRRPLCARLNENEQHHLRD